MTYRIRYTVSSLKNVCVKWLTVSPSRVGINGQWSKVGIILFLILSLITSPYLLTPGHATDPVDELQKQIDDLGKLREMSASATSNLEKELVNLDNRLKSVRAQLNQADQETKNLEKEIDNREADLGNQYQLLSARVRSFYILSRQNSTVLALLSADSASGLTKQLTYRSALAREDKDTIIGTTEDILSLESDKQNLDKRKLQLQTMRQEFEKNVVFFDKEIKGAKAYQAQLSQQISELTAKQKEILAAKSGTFQTTVGDVPLADDPASRPDYNPGFSPAFAAFSFGAPHYKGMSQYGAFGRAKEGQNADQILKAYYGEGIEIKKDYSTGITINVDGYGSFNIEDYTKRIYEMPTSWGDKGGMEALKAQAVAARSYALARTNNGAISICATEACQVFKPQEKGGKWNEAVDSTKGWVLVHNGAPFSAMYASTSGGYQEAYTYNGYTTPGFWDTKSGRSGWTASAYEKIAESPWFYKGWYKTRSGDACGRSHPWLNSEEMADILNAWALIVKSGQNEDRVTPAGSCWGGNPYSLSDLRNRSADFGGGFSSVSGASVNYSDSGVTASVTFQTNKGSVSINGAEFKKAFNLRAPGSIAIKSGLFNIEIK